MAVQFVSGVNVGNMHFEDRPLEDLEGIEHRAGSQVIKAMVPLAEMFGYATNMRSNTQGRATFSMHFSRYEEAPRAVAEEIVAKVQGKSPAGTK